MIDLRVYGDEQTQLRRALHPRTQGGRVDFRKFRDAAVGQEGFESDDTTLVQRLDVLEVARHQTAPERKIDERVSLERSTFQIEGGWINHGWVRIQRHVEKHGRAARGAGA